MKQIENSGVRKHPEAQKENNGVLMRPPAVAKYLGVSKWAVAQLVRSGRLHGIAITENSPVIRFITRESVEAFAKGV